MAEEVVCCSHMMDNTVLSQASFVEFEVDSVAVGQVYV